MDRCAYGVGLYVADLNGITMPHDYYSYKTAKEIAILSAAGYIVEKNLSSEVTRLYDTPLRHERGLKKKARKLK